GNRSAALGTPIRDARPAARTTAGTVGCIGLLYRGQILNLEFFHGLTPRIACPDDPNCGRTTRRLPAASSSARRDSPGLRKRRGADREKTADSRSDPARMPAGG